MKIVQTGDRGYLVLGNGGKTRGSIALSTADNQGRVRLVKLGADQGGRSVPWTGYLLPMVVLVVVLAVFRGCRS